jgi:hypothetical protein
MCLILPHQAIYVIGLLDAGNLRDHQVILTSNGTFTPSSYPYMQGVIIECWGGGGGGGGVALTAAGQCAVAGGGASGSYARHIMQMRSTSPNVTVVIGQGGAGGTAGPNTGSTGTDTTFDSTVVVAPGGAGGEGNSSAASQGIAQGGNPGTGMVGNTLQLTGSYGLDGYRGLNGTIGAAGAGGPAPFIGALVRGNGTDAGGAGLNAPVNSASGGSGAHNTPSQATDKAGGSGADGLCVVTILY